MMVKICGITSREDAVAAAEAGASALGFNFYRESPRAIAPERAADLGAGLAVTKVGVFVNEARETVARIMEIAALDIAQVYGDALYPGMRIWRACRISGALNLRADDSAEAFLLDGFSPTAYGGTGTTFNWSLAKGLPQRIILAGGLDGGNVRAAIEQARPWGVDACSRLESSPGVKDHEKMKKFIEAALSTI